MPSKNDVERLIPMSPELVSVLLAVMRRARGGEDQVPLSIRYHVNCQILWQSEPEPILCHLLTTLSGTVGGLIERDAPSRVSNSVAN